MSNLERPITATAAAWQPGLLDRWDLQGGADGASPQHANTKQIYIIIYNIIILLYILLLLLLYYYYYIIIIIIILLLYILFCVL